MPTLLLCMLAGVFVVHADEPPAARLILSVDAEGEGYPDFVDPAFVQSCPLTDDPAEVVAGRRSLKGDSRGSGAEWNEFLHTRQGLFAPAEAYTVSLEYRVIWREENAKFYVLFRRRGQGGNTGWQEWFGKPGERGTVTASFYAGRAADWYMIVGIQRKGAVAIDNIQVRTDPGLRPEGEDLPSPQRTWKSPGNTTYYVSSASGDDRAPGTSPQQPWRTLARVNAAEFGPGDRILLEAGSVWDGYLCPGGSGSEGAPIGLGMYGEGPRPRVAAHGKWRAALYLANVEHWEISDLDISNLGKARLPGRMGVYVQVQDFGTAHHIHLKRLEVHDVNGSVVKSEGGGCGISCSAGGEKVKSRFEDLLIEGCHLQRTDRNGIGVGGYWARCDWFPNLRVVIRENVLEDIGGDGIVPIACDGALVERNVLRGGRMRCPDYAAGIWPWSCDNTIVQFNEVSGMRGTLDGQGFDSDWNCRNSLFQYNYSHNNDGGFMLLCNDGSCGPTWNVGNIGTIVRYNISQDDGARTFHLSGPVRDTLIHNNTIFVGKGLDIHLVAPGNWGGSWPENTRFVNNIFYVHGKAKFDLGGMKGTVFDHNAYFGAFENRPEDAHALVVDPRLIAPGSGKEGLASLQGYRLQPDSPCVGAGAALESPGLRDFWGNALPAGGALAIGAHQP